MITEFCSRLGDAGLDAVATALESYADGDAVDIGSAEAVIEEVSVCLLEAKKVLRRLKAGTLTRAEARKMVVTEDDILDTRRDDP